MAPASDAVCVVGVGQARPDSARDDVNTTELAWEAVSAALEDAGVALADISGAVTASQDFWEGRTISSMAVNEVVGGTLGSEAKVAADGTMALIYAMARIEDGDQQLNLVLAHAKESQADAHAIERAGFDPFYHRALDPDETVVAALQAQLFYARSPFSREDAARVVVAARRRSDVLSDVEVEDVLDAEPTADPLGALDRAPRMDTATALVVCDGATAKRLDRPAARLVASAARTGPLWLDRDDLAAAPEIREAADEALGRAGWDRGDVDRVEICAPFAHQQLLLASALGLVADHDLVGRFEADESGMLINPSGGWHAGQSDTVAGLAAVGGTVRALRGGGRGLVHGATGLCTQSHSIVLVEGAA